MNIRVFSAFLQDRRAIVTIAEFKASSGECGGHTLPTNIHGAD